MIAVATHAVNGELAAWEQAIELLNDWLGMHARFNLERHESAHSALSSSAPIVALSLSGDLWRQAAFAEVDDRWQHDCAAIAPGRPVFVSTLLRHLPGDRSALARLRRLNLLALHLSQRFGVLVIDIDRVLAHHGALALQTDALLSGPRGQAAAARAMAGAVLTYGLAGLIDDAPLDDAIAAHETDIGGDIGRLLVPDFLVPRQATQVGARVQVHLAYRPSFDDRGLRGLLRDFRRGRVGAVELATQIGRKVLARLPARLNPFHRK